jgi:transcriptional regulator GlxA family with amidase domain
MALMTDLPQATLGIPGMSERVFSATMRISSGMDRRIEAVLEFIESSPTDAVSLDSAAAVALISPSRLRHLFKQYVGWSFHKYVMTVRLEQASDLLRTTTFTVERIAAMLGIQDRSHFARIFKQAYGISPGDARGGRGSTAHDRGESSRPS